MFNHQISHTKNFFSAKLEQALQEDFVKADKMMMVIILLHWIVASSITAFSYGFYLLGLVGGGGTTVIAFVGYKFFRGTRFSRVIMGISLMIFSVIFIQQHLGRIEMHFHIFIALAILIRYKDMLPILTAAVTIALHHVVFNYCQVYDISFMGVPIKVYNYGEGLDITFIHALFVVITVIVYYFLFRSVTHQFRLNIYIAEELESKNHFLKQMEGVKDEFLTNTYHELHTLMVAVKQQKATMSNQVEFTNDLEKSMEEISTVAAELVQTMQQVAAMSAETADFASHGQTDLSRMESAMHSMENASKSISGRLSAINEKTENITSVVTTITKVADQTNLLSLNAAIEAEKAGEYGRGFNVVAREIRRLADQTAIATLDIEQMVKEMQSAVATGVMEMDKFIAEVQRSAQDVSNINTHMNRIIQQVQALAPNFEEVNVAMTHQSENAQKIRNAMVDVSEGMQQTADTLEESFHAIEQLNEAARHLQDEVSQGLSTN